MGPAGPNRLHLLRTRHVRYSDFDAFGDSLETVDAKWRELFRSVYNTAEDAVVETQIANEFNVAKDFLALNRALVAHADRRHRRFVDLFDLGSREGEPVLTYTVFEALVVGLTDRGFSDSGRFAAIVDPDDGSRVVNDGCREMLAELAPAMDDYITDMLAELDGARRVDRAREFFETVRPVFERLTPRQRERLQTAPVRPSDAAGHDRWATAPADWLPDNRRANAHVADLAGTAEESDRPRGRGDSQPPGRVSTDGVAEAVRDRAAEGATPTDDWDALEREAERLVDVVRGPDGPDAVRVVEPADDGGDRERWRDAVRRSRRLREDLHTRIRRERRPNPVQGRRTGDLDGRRLVAATQGRQRVFARLEQRSEKDYVCLVVLDRSGSMRGRPIRTAETATARLVAALSAVGVDVSVLSVWESELCLELPFGGDPADHVDRLLTERSGGSTPLSDGIALACERVDRGDGRYPFVVVTDGAPDDGDAYLAALERMTFPVYGVYVGSDADGAYFDQVAETSVDSLGRTLEQLVRSLFTPET